MKGRERAGYVEQGREDDLGHGDEKKKACWEGRIKKREWERGKVGL